MKFSPHFFASASPTWPATSQQSVEQILAVSNLEEQLENTTNRLERLFDHHSEQLQAEHESEEQDDEGSAHAEQVHQAVLGLKVCMQARSLLKDLFIAEDTHYEIEALLDRAESTADSIEPQMPRYFIPIEIAMHPL